MKKRFANFLFLSLVFGMSSPLYSMDERRDDDMRHWERVAEGWTLDGLMAKIFKIKRSARRDDLSLDDRAILSEKLRIVKNAFEGLLRVGSDQRVRCFEGGPSTQGQGVGPA